MSRKKKTAMKNKTRKPKPEAYNTKDEFIDDENSVNGKAGQYEEDDEVWEGVQEEEEPPTKINPYKVLELEKDSTQDQIKTAYRKAALKHHPDKVPEPEKAEAHIKFQEVAFAYAILSDPKRRSRYDTTGRTSESFDDDDDFNWSDFYRAQFQDIITGDSIAKFKNEYQGSEEEKLDVIAAYVDFEGDMNDLFNTVMLSNPLDDEERYRNWIDEEVEAGRVEAYDAYAKESKKSKDKRMDKYRKEGKAAMEYAKKIGVYDKLFGDNIKNGTNETNGKKAKGDTNGLAALIQQRQKARANNFLADLEEKYVSKPKNGKKRRHVEEPIEEVEEPPEEMFQKNKAAMEKSKAKKVKSSEELKGNGVRKSKRTRR